MKSGAIFSPCRNYRYVLWRTWDTQLPKVLFIGLNPSAADENYNDPTIRRCLQFAQSWGYGGFYISNLFAFRQKDPAQLKKAKTPIGKENDYYILKYADACEKVILIWGNHGTFKDRDKEVLALLEKPYCIKINKTGHPAHPLYLKKELQPIPFPVVSRQQGNVSKQQGNVSRQ